MEYAIQVNQLSKEYWLFNKDYKIIPWLFFNKGHQAHKKALQNISFHLEMGEVLGVIGANGAGKSTLMKIIGGITYPTSGEIAVNGKVGTFINLGVGFHPDYTGRENLFYKGMLMGLSKQVIQEKMEEMIAFVAIEDYIDRPVRTYSAGMSARLGFALAIYSNPDILVIDEVFAVGDKAFKEKSKAKTMDLMKSGKSVLFSSHSDELILEFCQRVIVLDKGVLIYEGDVAKGLEIYNQLVNTQVIKQNAVN